MQVFYGICRKMFILLILLRLFDLSCSDVLNFGTKFQTFKPTWDWLSMRDFWVNYSWESDWWAEEDVFSFEAHALCWKCHWPIVFFQNSVMNDWPLNRFFSPLGIHKWRHAIGAGGRWFYVLSFILSFIKDS